jgi:thiosulfate/3-mercaptopyruvate sulfurtransferase
MSALSAHENATFVDASWVADHLDNPTVRLIEVDVSAAAYRSGHVPGAVLWNIYADLRRPRYVPIDDAGLAELLSRSGVDRDTTVVFYGYGAHLGLWLLRGIGHRNVHLLEDGREQWRDAGEAAPARAAYGPVRLDENLIVSRAGVVAATDATVVDVRAHAEYSGERFWPSGATEDVGRAGHIPGSVHLPIDALRDESGVFRKTDELERALCERGVSREQRIITYCTIGNRAAQAWFALTHLLDYPDVAVYHGGWAEWGHGADTPVATGGQ